MLALEILRHTPPAVFALLGYLVWQGVQALRPRTQPLWRIVIAPLAFALSGFVFTFTGSLEQAALTVWACALLAALPLGYWTGPRLTGCDPAGRRLSLAGSWLPLACNLTIFGLQYGIAVMAALHAAPSDRLAFARAAVSGATLGYCAGWLIALRCGVRDMRAQIVRRSELLAP